MYLSIWIFFIFTHPAMLPFYTGIDITRTIKPYQSNANNIYEMYDTDRAFDGDVGTFAHTNNPASEQHWITGTFSSVICPVRMSVVNGKRYELYKWLNNSVVKLVNTDTSGE